MDDFLEGGIAFGLIKCKLYMLWCNKMPNATLDEDLLSYALVGLEQRQRELASRIEEIRGRISQSGASKPASAPAAAAQPATSSASVKPAVKAGGKRALSPEARERIAEAQRKRWAATRKAAAPKSASAAPAPAAAAAPAATKKAATTKRTMSPEARARIAAAQRKRWAAARKQAQ